MNASKNPHLPKSLSLIVILAILPFFFGCSNGDFRPNVIWLNESNLASITQQHGRHIAFPDVVNFCGNSLITYREGDTHASDKGVVKVAVLDGKSYQVKLTIEDPDFDVRNPYFFHENNNLYLYASIFNFNDSKNGFINSKLYQLSSGCDLNPDPFFVNDVSWSVVYMPLNSSTASFGRFIKDREWCISIFVNQQKCLQTFDEEMSLLGTDGQYIGILRNHPKVGLPLIFLRYDRDGNLITQNNWCQNDNANSALVSPRVYIINGKYFVTYAEREILVSSLQRAAVWVKLFNTLDDLEKCRPSNIFKSRDFSDIDFGYPVIGQINGDLLLIWYGLINEKINLIGATIPNIN